MKISENGVEYLILPRYLYLNFTLHYILFENNIPINYNHKPVYVTLKVWDKILEYFRRIVDKHLAI